MDLVKGVWSLSRELIEILATHGWEPYDMEEVKDGQSMSWEQINSMQPAKEFLFGHNYFLLPKLKNGQTPKEAYMEAGCLGPALKIENANDPFWLEIRLWYLKDTALFSRLHFWENALVAFTALTSGSPLDNDIAMIDYGSVLEVFEKYFFVITKNELSARIAKADREKVLPEANRE